MKKLILNMLCMTLLGVLASCVDQQLETIEIKEVKATICDFDDALENVSRISYSVGESGYEAKWSEGDVLGVYPVGGDQVAFPLSKGTGANEAVFDGGAWALKNSFAYAAYYPFSAANYTIPENRIPVTYAGQTQTGNNTFDHFSTYDYLASKAEHPDFAGHINIKMKHVGCMFILKLTLPKAGTYTKLTLTSDNGKFGVQGTLDLTGEVPSITPTSTSGTVTINLKDSRRNRVRSRCPAWRLFLGGFFLGGFGLHLGSCGFFVRCGLLGFTAAACAQGQGHGQSQNEC